MAVGADAQHVRAMMEKTTGKYNTRHDLVNITAKTSSDRTYLEYAV